MSVEIIDKRGQGSRKQGVKHGDDTPPGAPPWFPVFVQFEQERLAQIEKWGDQRGHRQDGTGFGAFIQWAQEYKRQNDERETAGKPGVWSKILLEEIFEALAETDPEKLAAELVQAGAVITAWLEDLAYRKANA